MGIVSRFHYFRHTREDLLLLIIRVVLGVLLIQKGIFFLSHAEYLREMILTSSFPFGSAFLVSYIIFAHLFGGVFLIIGLLTRVVIVLQLPILAGALIFINPGQGEVLFNFEFFLSLFVFILLVYILVTGPGKVSMDDYLKKYLL